MTNELSTGLSSYWKLNETNKFLLPTSRCNKCGRFVSRGLWNHIKHSDICPERILILFPQGKLIKFKEYEKFK